MSAPSRRPPALLWVLLAIIGAAVALLIANHDGGATLGIANGEFAHLAVLVAILIFLAAGVFGKHLALGQVVRSTVTWAAIILVLVGVYASREELTGFAGRMLGALAPGLPISGRLAGTGDADSVAVIRSADGHFAVRTEVDQAAVTMLLDTGASFVTLTHDDAWKVGINPDALSYSVPIRTANGTMRAAAVTLGSLAIGPIERKRVRALVAPRGSLEQSLLGMTFLDTLKGYTISGDKLVMTP